MIVYTNVFIMAAKLLAQLEESVANLVSKFELTDEGEVDQYLGVIVE